MSRTLHVKTRPKCHVCDCVGFPFCQDDQFLCSECVDDSGNHISLNQETEREPEAEFINNLWSWIRVKNHKKSILYCFEYFHGFPQDDSKDCIQHSLKTDCYLK